MTAERSLEELQHNALASCPEAIGTVLLES